MVISSFHCPFLAQELIFFLGQLVILIPITLDLRLELTMPTASSVEIVFFKDPLEVVILQDIYIP